MKVANRREAIFQAVQAGIADVTALCRKFDISEATVRRDLHALQEDGRLLRVYGGAVATPILHEPEESLESRQSHHHASKAAIARVAASLVQDGDTLFIDGGTTTESFSRELAPGRAARIFTNNLLAVQTLAARGIAVSLIGGDLRAGSMSVFGPLADVAIERLTFDKVFTSADGVDVELGLCEGSIEQAWFKEKVFRRAREVIVLTSSEKLNRKSQMYWAPINRAWTLITDAQAQEHQLQPFASHAFVSVRQAPPAGAADPA
ncbi:MAG: Glucitol operon repressor [Paracidovorax wautersii]|uniref:Glucitol operon repressor n=1 Tax=Paracidovorax wautersii TaxID=1177982 RepID=A0A7V8FKS1_9BURK|nr:MAG: Glucitol operon repressor [Paracidovorax wautersii]